MRIAIVGAFSEYSLEASYKRAFEALGHQVLIFDFEKQYAAQILSTNRLTEKLGRSLLARNISKQLQEWAISSQPEIILVFKGRFITSDSLNGIKRALPDAPLLNFNPDSPWEPANSTTSLLESIPVYDIHFTWSRSLIDRFRVAGAKDVVYLPFAYDPLLHHPLGQRVFPKNATPQYDAIFVGTYDPIRDQLLSDLQEFRIAIWGNDWDRSRLVPKEWLKGNAVYGKASVELMEQSKVHLNLLRVQNAGSHNMRSFEIPATANLMLTDRTPEHLSFFTEGTEIECFANPTELAEKLRMLVSGEHSANYGRNAFVRVRDETYVKRATAILSAL